MSAQQPEDDRREDTSFAAQFAAAAERTGFGRIAQDEHLTAASVLNAVGGLRGIAEALLPSMVFLLVYPFTKPDLWPSLTASVGLALIFTIARLVTRSQPAQAIGGLVAAVASALLALWTGDGRDNFVLGLWTNGAYGAAFLISVLVGWPLIGIILGFLFNEGTSWRTDKRKLRVARMLTLIWFGLFALRLVVEVPLYVANNAEGLALTKLILGVPLYAAFLALTWVIVRALYPHGRPTSASVTDAGESTDSTS